MPVRRVAAIARALDADLVVSLRWRGGELDRLFDEGHASVLGHVAELLQAYGWITEPEVTYSVYGERGSIDLLAWHAPTRTLLVIEVKTELTSVEATLRKHDEKAGWRRESPMNASDGGLCRRRGSWCCRTCRRPAVVSSGMEPSWVPPARFAATCCEPGCGLGRWHRSGRAVSGLLFVSVAHPMRRRTRAISRKRIRAVRQIRAEREWVPAGAPYSPAGGATAHAVHR